jgi:signal transduction histidine kinase
MKKHSQRDDLFKKRQEKIDRLDRSQSELSARNEKLSAEIASLKMEKAALDKDHARIQSLLSHLQESEEKERTDVVHKIYDELGTLLAALKMDLNLMSGDLSDQNPEIIKFRDASNRHIDAAIDELRRLSDELRPPILDHLGLGAAMRWRAGLFQKQTGISCEIKIDPGIVEVENNVSIGLFRILQGLLENVTQHSRAKSVRIGFKRKEGKLELSVKDDGLGIADEKVSDPRSLGLISMQERAKSLGGSISIETGKSGGTQVTIKVPSSMK